MGIKMKTTTRSQRPLTYADLVIGDIFRTCGEDTLYIKTIETYKDYCVDFLDETEEYNSVKLSTGELHCFDDKDKVEQYTKEIEIMVDPKKDFASWI